MVVVGDRGDDDTGFVGECLQQAGATLDPLDRDALPAYELLDRPSLVLLLGSARSPYDPGHADSVARESALVRAALDDGVPVLAICYGAQLLALALGGTVGPSPRPEIGFFTHDSYDTALCPPGPWAQFHVDAYEPPASARVLGRSAGGCQGFVDESHGARALAWQFHPEVTPAEYSRWAGSLPDLVRTHGGDVDLLTREAHTRGPGLRDEAHALTEHAVAWLIGPDG